jgi:hypothetical protein
MDEFAAYIGIDWSDKKHDCCLVDAATGKKEFSIIKQTRQAIQEWATNLQMTRSLPHPQLMAGFL